MAGRRAGTGSGGGGLGAAEYRPGAVRVLAVGWWLFASFLAVDLVLGGALRDSLLGVPVLLLSAVLVHAMFWQPAVRVDDDGVELVNVLRTVRVPWALVQGVDTRWALAILTDGRRWTAWAAPSSGQRLRPVSRRETPWASPGQVAIAGSRAPGSSAGEAAVLVELRWEQWKQRPAGQRAADGHEQAPRTRWNRPTAAALAAAALTVLAVALTR